MFFKSTFRFLLISVLFFCTAFCASFAGLLWLFGAPWLWPLPEGQRILAVGSFAIAFFATDRFWRVVLLGE